MKTLLFWNNPMIARQHYDLFQQCTSRFDLLYNVVLFFACWVVCKFQFTEMYSRKHTLTRSDTLRTRSIHQNEEGRTKPRKILSKKFTKTQKTHQYTLEIFWIRFIFLFENFNQLEFSLVNLLFLFCFRNIF